MCPDGVDLGLDTIPVYRVVRNYVHTHTDWVDRPSPGAVLGLQDEGRELQPFSQPDIRGPFVGKRLCEMDNETQCLPRSLTITLRGHVPIMSAAGRPLGSHQLRNVD